MKFASLVVTFLLIAVSTFPAQAQRGGGHFGGSGSSDVEALESVIAESGLTAVFPTLFQCEEISSHFASPYRHDGSPRRDDRNSGLHGGIDLSLKDGTPLLAVAAGEVIATGKGGQLEGIFIWLRHAPTQTGLPYWVFTKYQHLSVLPSLNAGDQVQAGQVIAYSGNTGTVSKHYGPFGYPHLHMNTFYGRSGEYRMKGRFNSRVQADGAILDDPLIMHLGKISELSEVRGLVAERRKIMVPVMDEKGTVHPKGSKTVWPVSCTTKP